MKFFNINRTRVKRLALRRGQTDAEKLFWSKVRNRQVMGHRFCRQYGIGEYITDFYCPDSKVVVEIDGGQHYSNEGASYDEKRAAYMSSIGIRTIRFNNNDVLTNIDGVLEHLSKELTPSSRPDLA